MCSGQGQAHSNDFYACNLKSTISHDPFFALLHEQLSCVFIVLHSVSIMRVSKGVTTKWRAQKVNQKSIACRVDRTCGDQGQSPSNDFYGRPLKSTISHDPFFALFLLREQLSLVKGYGHNTLWTNPKCAHNPIPSLFYFETFNDRVREKSFSEWGKKGEKKKRFYRHEPKKNMKRSIRFFTPRSNIWKKFVCFIELECPFPHEIYREAAKKWSRMTSKKRKEFVVSGGNGISLFPPSLSLGLGGKMEKEKRRRLFLSTRPSSRWRIEGERKKHGDNWIKTCCLDNEAQSMRERQKIYVTFFA